VRAVRPVRVVVVLLCCAAACGPTQAVDRAELAVDARDRPDTDRTPDWHPEGGAAGAGGMGGSGGSGGSGGMGGDDDGGSGGDGGAEPDPDFEPDAPVDTSGPEPDAAPDTAPDGAPDAAQLPLVSISFGPPPGSTTNLTTEGSTDWRHWGLNSANVSNRKRTGPGIITMSPIPATPLSRYTDRPVRFSWSDGNPTLAASDVPDGIDLGGQNGYGFEIRVVGNPAAPRTIRLYLGVWGARARLTVGLSDQNGTIYTDSTLTARDPGQDRVYTVVFQPASAAQTLVLRWTVDTLDTQFSQYGNVTMQAVSVAE
jgi:hypothetical protein